MQNSGGADSGAAWRDLHEDMCARSNKWNGKKMEKHGGWEKVTFPKVAPSWLETVQDPRC